MLCFNLTNFEVMRIETLLEIKIKFFHGAVNERKKVTVELGWVLRIKEYSSLNQIIPTTKGDKLQRLCCVTEYKEASYVDFSRLSKPI